MTISKPLSGDYALPFQAYVDDASAQGDDALAILEQQESLLAAMTSWPDAKAGYRYADGKWSVREVVGHMADTERIFAYRLLRIARGDATPLPGFDENAYQLDQRLRGPVAGQRRRRAARGTKRHPAAGEVAGRRRPRARRHGQQQADHGAGAGLGHCRTPAAPRQHSEGEIRDVGQGPGTRDRGPGTLETSCRPRPAPADPRRQSRRRSRGGSRGRAGRPARGRCR